MFADPQRFLRLDAARRAFFGRSARIDRDEVRAFAFALVFEHPQERSPCGPRTVAGVAGEFDQPFRVKVLDGYEVVLVGVVRRELVQEVAALPFQVGVTPGDGLALLFPVVRPVLFPREVALGAFQPLAFV